MRNDRGTRRRRPEPDGAQYAGNDPQRQDGVFAVHEDLSRVEEPADEVLIDCPLEIFGSVARHTVVDRKQHGPMPRRAGNALLERPDAAARERFLDAGAGLVWWREHSRESGVQTANHAARAMIAAE